METSPFIWAPVNRASNFSITFQITISRCDFSIWINNHKEVFGYFAVFFIRLYVNILQEEHSFLTGTGMIAYKNIYIFLIQPETFLSNASLNFFFTDSHYRIGYQTVRSERCPRRVMKQVWIQRLTKNLLVLKCEDGIILTKTQRYPMKGHWRI